MVVDRRATVLAVLWAVGFLLAGSLLIDSLAAQTPSTKQATQQAMVHLPSPSEITFATIADAQANLPVDIEQVRYVNQASTATNQTDLTGIQERLRTVPTDGGQLFRIDFHGLVGHALTDAERAERESIYWPHSGYLHQHGGFRVHDPNAAESNYMLFFVDSRTRLGRPTHRFIVFPRFFARNVWLIEVDADTSYPLFSAEYTSFGLRTNSLEVTSFSLLGSDDQANIRWWEPTNLVGTYPSFEAAQQAMPSLAQAGALLTISVPTTSLPFGYSLREARLVVSDISAKDSIVLVYSDGIDEFFVIHSTIASPMRVPALPSGGTTEPYAVAFYQDMSVAQFMFQVHGVETMVIGRAGQLYLASLTRELLVKAVTGQ